MEEGLLKRKQLQSIKMEIKRLKSQKRLMMEMELKHLQRH
jgi:hypothetical protein